MLSTRRRFLAATVALVATLPLTARAQSAKRALTQADWDTWRSISGAALSPDGKWAAYSLIPQVGDGDLIVRSTTGTTEYRVARGYLGRPNNVPGGLRPHRAFGEADPSGPNASPAQFTADSRYAWPSPALPAEAETERPAVHGDGRKGPGATGPHLADLLRLSDGQVTTMPQVRSYRLPRESGAWVAYVESDTAAADSAEPVPGAAPPATAGTTGRRWCFGT